MCERDTGAHTAARLSQKYLMFTAMIFINIQNVYTFCCSLLRRVSTQKCKHLLFSHSYHIRVFICWLTWLMAHIFIKSLTPIVIHNNFRKWCAHKLYKWRFTEATVANTTTTLRRCRWICCHRQQHEVCVLRSAQEGRTYLAEAKEKPADLFTTANKS